MNPLYHINKLFTLIDKKVVIGQPKNIPDVIQYPYYMYQPPTTVVTTTEDKDQPPATTPDNTPWIIAGIVGLGALFVGVMLGRK